MADIGNPVGGFRPVLPTRPAGQGEAVRAAQRAFFQAALSQADVTPSPAVRTPAARAAPVDLSTPPARLLRPGSLLDIKV